MSSSHSQLILATGTTVNTWGPIIKRLLDVAIALTLLIALSPVLLAIWMAIRLDSEGPAIFRQKRVGKDGVDFIMLKFRTMLQNAPDLRNPDNSTFSSDADPRVTRLGGMLRRTSLDELPQLINVVRGEMSLIGPRPELPEGQKTYLPHQFSRLTVRPGITGWAAINGRNDLPMPIKRNLDAWYAENWTLGLDAKILWRTISVVLSRRNINSAK
jgi:undecaprenyl phosphate N,N'-diacetylbacillosamine 1-phosphate transferase